MGQSLTEKIIRAHLRSGDPVAGNEAGIEVDCVLTQDSAGTMAYLQFEAIGAPRIKSKLAVTYIDHQTLQDGFENADDHCYLQSAARKFGGFFSKAGNGICHQTHLERFSRPGWTMVGTDSHTPTGGAVGMLAIGVGGLDAAVAMGGGPFFLTYPRLIRISLVGRLRPWCTAKDVALEVLRLLGVKGNVGSVLEYGGEGVATLSVPERATIANMGTETGVTTSVFPSDEITRQFFAAQQREAQWLPLAADPDAVYDREITIDLGSVEPSVAAPHSPGNVHPVRQFAGLKVDQVLIGSCTNSSYRDLMIVASMLAGRQVKPEVSAGVIPGTRQVYQMLAANGALGTFLAAGFRVFEPTCGFCCGCGQAPKSGAVSIRTNNRNFKGRSGTADANVYLVSPETAAAAAITGCLTDPRELGMACPAVQLPEQFLVDDSMILAPDFAGGIVRGPNIGMPPHKEPLADSLDGIVALKVGDNITTDHILPAGSLLKYRSNIAKYSEYVFRDVDGGFPQRCRDYQKEGKSSVIVAGLSYGQGSSREHAAICPMFLGVRAVIAKGIERIHWSNLVNFGILPLFFTDDADYETISAGDQLAIDNLRQDVRNATINVRNVTRQTRFAVSCPLSERQQQILLAGGLLNFTKGG
ncbi:MAG: aconitate hydratase [Sporomusaceae bacterium]|nr:aconitate hydratase [Sporomusaceae bacterium]